MRAIFLYIAIAGFAIIGGCMAVSDLAGSQSSDNSKGEISHLVNISEILNNSEKYDGKLVTIEGTYLGWSGPSTGAIITRSDWGIEDETGVIHVSGVYPPLDTFQDVGANLIVSGVVVTLPKGPVIKAKIVTIVGSSNSSELK